jgi:hypothetical protein
LNSIEPISRGEPAPRASTACSEDPESTNSVSPSVLIVSGSCTPASWLLVPDVSSESPASSPASGAPAVGGVRGWATGVPSPPPSWIGIGPVGTGGGSATCREA